MTATAQELAQEVLFPAPEYQERTLDYDFLQVEYEAVRACLNKNHDFWTIISGPPGQGKSTVAQLLALITDPAYDPTKNVHWDTLSFVNGLLDHDRGSTEIFDEAIGGASGKNAMTTENKALEETGEIVRGLNHHAIMCIPRFWGYSPYWRNHRADAWLHVERRGRLRVHFPSQDIYSKADAFWVYACTVEYPTLEGTTLWDAYDAAKQAYLRPAIRRRVAKLQALETEDHPFNPDAAEDARDDAASRLYGMRAEASANPAHYKDAKGRWDLDLLMNGFNVTEAKAKELRRALKGKEKTQHP